MKAVRFFKTGDVSVLQLLDVPLPAPQKGQLLVKNKFSGINMIDTYMRFV
jgi:NADPH2:quinone reductase